MAIETPQVVRPPQEAVEVPTSDAPLKLTGWDHIAFSVPDLVAAERWYVEVLNAEIVGRWGWAGDTINHGPPHEDILVGKQMISLFLGDQIGGTNVPRLFHYAFNCRDMAELDQWKAHLVKKGVDADGPVAHPGFGAVSVYFNDPWGTKLEITTWLPDFDTAMAEVSKREGGRLMGPGGRGAKP